MQFSIDWETNGDTERFPVDDYKEKCVSIERLLCINCGEFAKIHSEKKKRKSGQRWPQPVYRSTVVLAALHKMGVDVLYTHSLDMAPTLAR